jgi:hypothetical protein
VRWKLNNSNGERVKPDIYRCFCNFDKYQLSGDILIKDYTVIKNVEYQNYADTNWLQNKWANWFICYRGDCECYSRYKKYLSDSTFIRDEEFYELIGKSLNFKVGWDDVQDTLRYEEIEAANSKLKDNYVRLWNDAHVQ